MIVPHLFSEQDGNHNLLRNPIGTTEANEVHSRPNGLHEMVCRRLPHVHKRVWAVALVIIYPAGSLAGWMAGWLSG